MANEDLMIYFQRWQALDRLIGEMAKKYDTKIFDRKQTVAHLLKRLRAFAAGQFGFFYYGFGYGDPGANVYRCLQSWDEFPAEDVLTGILDQIGNDLALIERAADQRLSGSDTLKITLQNADRLATLALLPAIDNGLIDKETRVLTHFQKAANFYSIPYANVALIGIPFTCATTDTYQDYLAIPHEAGHYVYRHLAGAAKDRLKEVRRSLAIPEDYRVWINDIFEEMCADIYGCLIGGPVMALDFQDLGLAYSEADFSGGDGEHPNAALRPFIYSLVLASQSAGELVIGDWAPMAEYLSDLWQRQLFRRHVTDFVIKNTKPDGLDEIVTAKRHDIAEAVHGETMVKSQLGRGPLGDVVHGVVETLLAAVLQYREKTKPGIDTHNLEGWAGKIETKIERADLYEQYNKNMRSLLKSSVTPPKLPKLPKLPKPLEADPSEPWSWDEWSKKFVGNLPTSECIPSGDVKHPDDSHKDSWGYVLSADGWTTSGPSVDPGHPAF